MEQICQV